MRFVENGPDVPDELIEQGLSRRTVFLCGAGVSMRVGLPSFEELTEKIYSRLGETRANDLAEQDAFSRREYDRVLRALEKRLLRSGERSRVRDACAAELRPPNDPLADHEALLALSQDKQGRVRLLTTNFDTLFERAAHGSGRDVASHAAKALPKPAGMADHGILHLHGRIADADRGLSETDLVLTSADFGDAYLRDGWASQYMEDRIRTCVLVLLGYRAEDAALRLLLETLDVDRERFPDLNKIYALDTATAVSKAVWTAKGIVAVEATDRDVLYGSVQEWSRYARAPQDYAQARVREILLLAPSDTSDFEREQLSFFLAHHDARAMLLEYNPSLAWLRTLADLKIVGLDQPWLVPWLELNLEKPDAVRDVVANIGLLGTKVGEFLDFRLRHLRAPLTDPYRTAWDLIVRHLRSHGGNGLGDGWFAIQPRLGRGERTTEVLELLTDLLRPRVQVTKRFSIEDMRGQPANELRDLMSVGLETDENIDVPEIVRAWPENLAPELDVRLLTRLSEALERALDDAVTLGLEVADEFSATDSDVPSVADHPQNRYRHGFLPIVRVIADVWTQLARKDSEAAMRFVQGWSDSPHKLFRRLALFAAADPAVTPDMVSMVLARLSIAQHFSSNTTVELFRVLRARWHDLPEATRREEERIFAAGPEIEPSREGVDVERLVDRARYEGIGVVRDLGEPLAPETVEIFADIQRRYPEWQQRSAEETGFHVWMGEVTQVGPADAQSLGGVADEDLVATAQRLDANAPFGDGNHWSTLCGIDPERALRGLIAEANAERWSPAAWRALLSSRAVPSSPAFAEAMASALIEVPAEVLSEILLALANWLATPQALALDAIFWRLWDRTLANLSEEPDDHNTARYFDRAINTPVGNLAEAILKKLPSTDVDGGFARVIEPRLDALCGLPGHNGVLARVRLGADLAFLHARAPSWTTAWLVPSFVWTDPLALAMWSARVYSSVVGSPALFGLTKEPFLELFGRVDVPSKLKEDYADWLLIPLFSNQAHEAGYPLTFVEARTALRLAGPGALWQIGHLFAVEMEAAKSDEKLRVWRDIVGPVFRGTWPLDVELRTSRANFKLVQMLRASGQAFPEAVDDVIPFLAKESGQGHVTTIHSLGEADAELYELAPRKLLDLVDAIVGDSDAGSVYGLKKVLDRIVEADATVVGLAKYQRLRQLASRE